MSKKITVIGSTNVDFIMKVGTLPARGETITDGQFMQTFGGKGANQAVAVARAGGDTTFFTCLGRDIFAPRILKNFEEDGMNTDPVKIIDEINCGTALVMFDDKGDNYLTVDPGSNYALSPEMVLAEEDLIASSDIIVLQMEIPADSIEVILDLAAKHQRKVFFNYAPVKNLDIKLSKKITGLIVNEIEAGQLLGKRVSSKDEALSAAKELTEKGPAFAVITLGSKGVVYSDGTEDFYSAGFKVSAVDTTAAGDTFCGSLAVALSEGYGVPEALRFACAAAALAVTSMGAQPSIPKRGEIDRFLRERE